MKKRVFLLAALGLAAVLVAGGLVASNMGFKVNYLLEGPESTTSSTGSNRLGLPYNQQTSLTTAEDLIIDINADAGANVFLNGGLVSRRIRTTNALEFYTGFAGTNFTITPGEGYNVIVDSSVSYIIVGSHDPTLGIVLDGPGDNGSATGSQLYSNPYHSTAANAEDLINEINAAAGANVFLNGGLVSRRLRISNANQFYTGFAGTNFALTPGEAYTVIVDSGVTFVPSHY